MKYNSKDMLVVLGNFFSLFLCDESKFYSKKVKVDKLKELGAEVPADPHNKD